jgi:mannose/fructose/N-acetylgalactosamine-specific phosphotransferase system component IID
MFFSLWLLVKKNIRPIFGASKLQIMEFGQYLGFLAFLTVLSIGFWLMFFLVPFVSYWLGGAVIELLKERRAAKKLQQ